MNIKLVYGILPVIIFYTDNISKEFGGITNGPIVRIRKKYKDDIGLHEHEFTHVKQWYRTFFTHPIWYMLIEKYRLMAEVEAYKVQASYYNYDSSDWMADAILKKYNISGVSKEEIIALLKK